MKHHRKLNINFNPFDYLPEHYYEESLHELHQKPVFNKFVGGKEFGPVVNEWFESLGWTLNGSMFFSYLPNSISSIHVDGFKTAEEDRRIYAAINWSKGGKGSMSWFEPLPDTPEVYNHTEVAQSPYVLYNRANTRLVDYCDINQPTLIDVGIPHRGQNLSPEPRFTLTLRWLPVMTFQEAEFALKNHWA